MDQDVKDLISNEVNCIGHDGVRCCCPRFFVFLLDEINISCVQVFNGACEDWRPGTNCGTS